MEDVSHLYKNDKVAIYAYADETIFDIERQSGNHAVGYGVLISKTPISLDVVSEAMQQLKEDPDFNGKQDSVTISNGYFHASEDSKNAHSHFCNAIRKHVKGRFNFNYFSLSKEQPPERQQQERFLNSCLNGASIEFFNSLQEVNLVIEGRMHLTEHHLNRWREKIYELFEGASYETPFYKTFFPKINVEIGNKLTPGLQVADFLSWTASRVAKVPSDRIWFDRLRFVTSSIETTESVKQKGINGYLNEAPGKWTSDYPQRFVRSETNDDVIHAYIIIERFIRNIERSDFSPENIHLWDGFKKAQDLCVSLKHFVNDDLRLVARTFIRVFDSLPIYSHIKDDDAETWTRLFHAKEIATLLVRRESMHMGTTQDHIQRWRFEALSNHRSAFLQEVQAT